MDVRNKRINKGSPSLLPKSNANIICFKDLEICKEYSAITTKESVSDVIPFRKKLKYYANAEE